METNFSSIFFTEHPTAWRNTAIVTTSLFVISVLGLGIILSVHSSGLFFSHGGYYLYGASSVIVTSELAIIAVSSVLWLTNRNKVYSFFNESIGLSIDETSSDCESKIEEISSKQEPDANVKKIREKYKEDVHKELLRLNEARILPDDFESKLEELRCNIEKSTPFYRSPETIPFVQVLYGHALEIQNLYAKTHYTFTHAQASKWAALPYLIKTLFKKMGIEGLQMFKCLRVLHSESLKKPLAIDNDTFSDHDARAELLSVDAYIKNDVVWESTLFFLMSNVSIYSRRDLDAIQNSFISTLKDIFGESELNQKKEEAEDFFLKFEKLISDYLEDLPCGMLYMICIPKEKIEADYEKFLYRAHPFGKKCNCHPKEENLSILQELQKSHLTQLEQCSGRYHPPKHEDPYYHPNLPWIPQYRLHTSELLPENGVKIFSFSPLSKENKEAVRQELDQLADDLIKAFS